MVFGARFGEALFEDLNCDGERLLFGFSDEQVYVIGHDDVAENVKYVEFACAFEQSGKGVAGGFRAEDGLVAGAAEGDEVRELCLLVAVQAR